MEPNGCGGGGGPAPFLLKTYDMVDDSSTDGIVSWSSGEKSFVVWNQPEFARVLLPTYFKHNNFSSFIRQLNTYGFRKIDPERWEFANEDFVKDQKHLLKNIHRRKPIHSHSHPQGSLVDPERAAFEEEIEKLSREKAAIEANVMRFREQRSTAKIQLDDLSQRIDGMELRQDNLLKFLDKAVQNPILLENLACKIEAMDISAYNKKRRLPQIDHSKPSAESLFDNNTSSRPEFGNVFHQDFSNKLRLELSPTVSDINLVSQSAQSSNEDGMSPNRITSEGDPKDAPTRTGFLFPSETVEAEVLDTGTPFAFKTCSSLQQKEAANGSPRAHSSQQRLASKDEVDGHISCQLNLSLASSSLQINKSPYSTRMSQPSQSIELSTETMSLSKTKESDAGAFQNDRNMGDVERTLSSLKEVPNKNQEPTAPQVRVNDVFWEQFLTERPGSSENEEASSTYRAIPYEEQEDRQPSQMLPKNAKNMRQLNL